MNVLASEEGRPAGTYTGYLEASSQPLTCFIFTLPLFIVYHGGLWWLNSFSDLGWANAADIAIADALGRLGMAGPLLSFIFVIVTFLIMHALSKSVWRLPSILVWFTMILESLLFALPVFILSRLVMSALDSMRLMAASGGVGVVSWKANLILSCGAGAYEEFLFRLILMGALVFFFGHVLGIKSGWRFFFAAILQSLLFAASHHLPGSPEPITSLADFRAVLPVFTFRAVAGIYFAFLYIERGFGIAAGSHAGYDLLVVGLDLFLPVGSG